MTGHYLLIVHCIYFFGTGELLRVFGYVMYIHAYDSYCRNSTNSVSVQLYLFSVTPFSPHTFAPTTHHTAAADDRDGNVDATPHAIKECHAVDGSILNVRTQGDNAMRPPSLRHAYLSASCGRIDIECLDPRR